MGLVFHMVTLMENIMNKHDIFWFQLVVGNTLAPTEAVLSLKGSLASTLKQFLTDTR